MERPRTSTLLLVGLIVSLALHATVLLPALVSVMTSKVTGYDRVRAKFAPEDFESLPEDQVRLGIEQSQASTMTWIGYQDYEEHMARLAEVEQAEFQTEPTGAEPTPPVPLQPPSPVQEVVEASADAPPMQDPRESDQQTPPTAEQAAKELETFAKAPEAGPGPPEGDPINPLAKQQALEAESVQQTTVNQPDTTPDPDRAQQADPQQVQAQPQQQPQQQAPPGKPGDQADMESDATSTVEVSMEQMTLGRPLAAKGLQIKPRKPVFTTLTLMTAAPGNPKAELRFRRDGRPVIVRLIESSGDPRIDEAVLNSLYRWRAAGEPLRELRRGQTMPIQIRILLGR